MLAEAEAQAAVLRAEAASLADKLRREARTIRYALEARGSGLARIAAKAAANKLRKETDLKADAIVREAESRCRRCSQKRANSQI